MLKHKNILRLVEDIFARTHGQPRAVLHNVRKAFVFVMARRYRHLREARLRNTTLRLISSTCACASDWHHGEAFPILPVLTADSPHLDVIYLALHISADVSTLIAKYCRFSHPQTPFASKSQRALQDSPVSLFEENIHSTPNSTSRCSRLMTHDSLVSLSQTY